MLSYHVHQNRRDSQDILLVLLRSVRCYKLNPAKQKVMDENRDANFDRYEHLYENEQS